MALGNTFETNFTRLLIIVITLSTGLYCLYYKN